MQNEVADQTRTMVEEEFRDLFTISQPKGEDDWEKLRMSQVSKEDTEGYSLDQIRSLDIDEKSGMRDVEGPREEEEEERSALGGF